MKTMRKIVFKATMIFAIAMVISIMFSPFAFAAEMAGNKYYMGAAVNTGKDTGYSESEKITEKDPHFGWNLGSFYVSGYTRETEDADGNPVFLKTVGDTVTLWFELEQDISMLNGDEMLSISGDTNGYDEYFGIEKTDFGRGTLIIRHTDYQNHAGDPVIYTDYLAANATYGAAVEVEFFEEGDYEVALNYEIREDKVDVFGWKPVGTYENYRIFFRFSVRNGNCMVYPFDVLTGDELLNTAITENGFYLDLARSRYLDIDIKKEVLNEGADGLVEDVRFNRPAKDGDQYTDEGIYTITVSNRYTGQQTVKKIYVGSNEVLMAYVTTGLSVPEIKELIDEGATIAEDGTIIAPQVEIPEVVEQEEPVVEVIAEPVQPEVTSKPVAVADAAKSADNSLYYSIGAVCVAAVVIVGAVWRKRKAAKSIDSIAANENEGSEE